jgi:DNA-binding GntR family transcriptional regulator
VSDDVYDVLLELLMDQRIAPGERVSIDGWAREFDVSPTPVREALMKLAGEGLLVKHNMKGYTAAPLLDNEGIRELYQLRGLVEPFVAGEAARNASETQLAELASMVSQMNANVVDAAADAASFEGYREFADLDDRFHLMIAEAAGNRLISELLVRLRSHRHVFRVMAGLGARDATAEHLAIAESLIRRDASGAEAMMARHLERSHARFRSVTE